MDSELEATSEASLVVCGLSCRCSVGNEKWNDPDLNHPSGGVERNHSLSQQVIPRGWPFPLTSLARTAASRVGSIGEEREDFPPRFSFQLAGRFLAREKEKKNAGYCRLAGSIVFFQEDREEAHQEVPPVPSGPLQAHEPGLAQAPGHRRPRAAPLQGLHALPEDRLRLRQEDARKPGGPRRESKNGVARVRDRACFLFFFSSSFFVFSFLFIFPLPMDGRIPVDGRNPFHTT